MLKDVGAELQRQIRLFVSVDWVSVCSNGRTGSPAVLFCPARHSSTLN